MRVFVHTKETHNAQWQNEGRDFLQLPHVGEYIALASHSEWYRVQVVVHCPFKAQYDAEIYALHVDHHEAIRTPFAEVSS